MEEWKPVPGLEDIFHVTVCGKVKTVAHNATGIRNGKPLVQRRPEKILSPNIGRNGYFVVAAKRDGRRKKYLVHRLVAFAFVPGYEYGLTVNHINGIKTDNRAENLEWVSRARNSQLQWETGLVDLRGDNHPSRKLSSRKVRIIRRLLRIGATCNEIADLVDVNPTTIYLIRDGKRWANILRAV